MNTEVVGRIIERWGFPVLVALACGVVLRNDVLIPLVEEHRMFVRQLSETQKDMVRTQNEISKTLSEQARLLWQMSPDSVDRK